MQPYGMHPWSERAVVHPPHANTMQMPPRAGPSGRDEHTGRLSHRPIRHSYNGSEDAWISSPHRQQAQMAVSYANRAYPSSNMQSRGSTTPSSESADRVIIQATLDNEHFSVVNVTGLDSAPTIREMILRKLKLPWTDLHQWGLFRTEIGESDLTHSPLIDDDTLLALCLQLGDDKGTIKFRVLSMLPSTDDVRDRVNQPPVYASPSKVPYAWSSPDRTFAQAQPPSLPSQTLPVPPLQPSQSQRPHIPSSKHAPPLSAPFALNMSPHDAPTATGVRHVPGVTRRPPSWSMPNSSIIPGPSTVPLNDAFLTPYANRHMSPNAAIMPISSSFPSLQPGMVIPMSKKTEDLRLSTSPHLVPPMYPPAWHPSSSMPVPAVHPSPNGRPASSAYETPNLSSSPCMDEPPAAVGGARRAPHVPSLSLVPGHDLDQEHGSIPASITMTNSSSAPASSPPSLSGSASSSAPAPTPTLPPSMIPGFARERPKARTTSNSSDARPFLDDHIYPTFYRGSEYSSAARPLPLPSPNSSSPMSSQISPWRSEEHVDSNDHSARDTPSAVSTPLSDHGSTDGSMQRLLAHLRVSQDRKSAASEFDSFADDTLGGTFAQPLDAATLTSHPLESDTVHASPQATTPRDGSRPVLSLSISPPPERVESSAQVAPPQTTMHARENSGTSWALRPPAEELYEQLDNLFPRHDLDKPLNDMGLSPQPKSETPPSAHKDERGAAGTALVGGESGAANGSGVVNGGGANLSTGGTTSSGSAPKTRRAPRGLSRHQHHSIRVIAQNRRQLLEKTKQEERRQMHRNDELLNRRRSTKLWGGRMVEMRTNGANSVGIVPNGLTESDPENRPVFKWVKGELIGKGTYGRVYLALNATTGEMIAVKQVELPRTAADRDSSRQRSIVSALKSEIETLKDLDHPNVVTCLGFEETLDTLSIFLEYVPGGSIGSCLRRYGKFEEDMTSSFLNQTLQGLAYLHKQGILHRDLKADNLLVDYQGTCKISDFGTVRRSEDIYANVENMSLQGTIFWMAPEVVSLSRKGYSAKVDIWSLGCVVLEMLAGRRPWSDEEAIQAMFKIGAQRRAPPVPPDVKLSKPAAHFLRNCFEIDPDRRPTAARLLEHVFAWPSPNWCFEDSGLYKLLCQSKPPPASHS